MTAIVRLALARPYTFVVMAILIAIFGVRSVLGTPTDIFPNINIPVISVIWSYTGLPPDDMANRIVSIYERSLSTTVNDIEHIDSQSLAGYGIVKIFFQPTVNISAAEAQVTSISQTILKQLPAGITPPFLLVYDASSVPIIQLALSSDTLSQTALNDLAVNFIRPALATIPGAQLPNAYGGAARQVQIDLDQNALRAHGISATDVGNALARQNLITPVGTEKIGTYEYTIDLNDSPKIIEDFDNLPIKVVNGAVVFMRDVAHVHNGSPPQTNVVQSDGRKGVLMSVLKIGSASTLDIIAGVKARLPAIQATLPEGVNLKYVADQSGFVQVLRRRRRPRRTDRGRADRLHDPGLSRQLALDLHHHDFDTPGGAELPDRTFGAWPDDQCDDARRFGARGRYSGRRRDGHHRKHQSPHGGAGRRHPDGHHPRRAGNHGPGDDRAVLHLHRFRPAAFAWRGRRLSVPAVGDGGGLRDDRLLHFDLYAGADDGAFSAAQPASSFDSFGRWRDRRRKAFSPASNTGSNIISNDCGKAIWACWNWRLQHRFWFAGGFLCVALASLGLAPFLGQDFFPSIDAGAIRIHMRAPTGTRIEETTRLTDQVEQKIRALMPPDRIAEHRRQYWLAEQRHQYFIRKFRHDRRFRCRHIGHLE